MATVDQALDDADRILSTWQGNADFSLATLTKEQMAAQRDAVRAKATLIEQKRVELKGLTESLQDEVKELSQMNTRAKSGFRAVYGPDSPQVAQVGITRTSDRKPRTRKVKPTE
nr:hypothetical protein [Armatimonas sp.]